MPKKPLFVAEIKTISPFGFSSPYQEKDLINLAIASGDIVAAHTSPLWGGGFRHLREVANLVHLRSDGKKVLAKGVHGFDEEIQAALDCGADYVLVVGRIPAKRYLSKCWIEFAPFGGAETKDIYRANPDAVVINARNIMRGNWMFHAEQPSWPTAFLEDRPKNSKTKIVQASGIKYDSQVQSWADAFIVGEGLPQFLLNRELKHALKLN